MTTTPYFNQDHLLMHISQTLPQFSTLKPEDADVSAEDGLIFHLLQMDILI